ncbi:MAG: FAD-binding oxidoreductase, partial [Sphingobacteriales bacterium]
MPQAVARCANEADVIAVLAHAQKYNVPITPRCGGHGYAGYSTTTGIVIDVSPMNTITVGTGTATIGAGAKLIDVYDQLTAQGVAIPTGSCSSVGIAGITLGGGIGIVDRAYGLTCDNLISADVITADGKKITCNESNEPDLFWALRGGGGGNFGVVTSFTFKTHATSDITTLQASFPLDDLENVMSVWQAWPETLPDNIWGQAIVSWIGGGSPTVGIRVFCIGSQADAEPYWTKFLADVQSIPLGTSITTATYRSTMMGNCAGANMALCRSGQRNAFAASSDFFDVPVPETGWSKLKNFINESIVAGNFGMIILDLMGGVIDNFQPTDTAFIHRKAIFSAEYYTFFNGSAPNATVDAAQVWENSFRTVMKPWSTG